MPKTSTPKIPGQFGAPSAIVADLVALYDVDLSSGDGAAYLARNIASLHGDVVRGLDEILDRATTLRAALVSDASGEAMTAILSIEDSAGASGPIGSKWSRVVRDASVLFSAVNAIQTLVEPRMDSK